MKFVAIIPARFSSSRFPGKPLALLGGKTIISRVYERVSKVIDEVYVATDDERIYNNVLSFGGRAIMTSPSHRSGTDRCEEAFLKSGSKADVVINVQGDEPFIDASQLEEIKKCFNDSATQIATLVKPFSAGDGLERLENPNSPKVVIDSCGYAIYFSRSVIPYIRGVEKNEWLGKHTFFKHIGIYAYKAEVLSKITKLPQSILEKAESLEQLRWIENGIKIKVGHTNIETIGIDTPDDLERAEKFMESIGKGGIKE